MSSKHTPITKTVKDTVDLVFELTTSNPDGYEMKANDFGNYGRLVVKILHQRGIIERVRMKNRVHSFMYKWAVASAPTKCLYGSITQELTDMVRKKNAEYHSKKKSAGKVPVDVIAEEPIENNLSPFETEREKQEAGVVVDNPTIEKYTIEELWAEIKRRGVVIEDNRLALHTVTYFE